MRSSFDRFVPAAAIAVAAAGSILAPLSLLAADSSDSPPRPAPVTADTSARVVRAPAVAAARPKPAAPRRVVVPRARPDSFALPPASPAPPSPPTVPRTQPPSPTVTQTTTVVRSRPATTTRRRTPAPRTTTVTTAATTTVPAETTAETVPLAPNKRQIKRDKGRLPTKSTPTSEKASAAQSLAKADNSPVGEDKGSGSGGDKQAVSQKNSASVESAGDQKTQEDDSGGDKDHAGGKDRADRAKGHR